MERSDRASAPLGGFDAEAVLGLSSPASPGLSCSISTLNFSNHGTSAAVEYSPSGDGWKFADPCPPRGPILFRNAVSQAGDIFDVLSLSPHAFSGREISAVFVSRNAVSVGEDCFMDCGALQIVAFERDSHLREIGPRAFYCCQLRSIAIPSLVRVIRRCCFQVCQALGSAIFERPSNLATIEKEAFSWYFSLDRFFIPASVTAIDGSAFSNAHIRSIEIEEGSVSFRVVNDLLVDFDVRSLVWTIGSPESIVIPSSVEELGPYCCAWKKDLRTVEFERDSNLRSIDRSAFAVCSGLESIWIPSSVEVLHEGCLQNCRRLRTVTFGCDSKLRLIERDTFRASYSLSLVGVPASAEIVDPPHAIRVERVSQPSRGSPHRSTLVADIARFDG
jgi:hypothetical protein